MTKKTPRAPGTKARSERKNEAPPERVEALDIDDVPQGFHEAYDDFQAGLLDDLADPNADWPEGYEDGMLDFGIDSYGEDEDDRPDDSDAPAPVTSKRLRGRPKKGSSPTAPPTPAPAPDKPKRTYVRKPKDLPPFPPPDGDLQSNFCRNPRCENFGVPPQISEGGKRQKGKGALADGYAIDGGAKPGGREKRKLKCTKCGQRLTMKSNVAIREEIARIDTRHDLGRPPSCPNEGCLNHGVSILTPGATYVLRGYTEAGSRRWTCQLCSKTFALRKRHRARTTGHHDATLLRLLVNKNSIQGIRRITGLHPQRIYEKIDFLHERCLAFMAERERLLPTLTGRTYHIASDRQDYTVNWTSRRDRKSTVLTGIGTADLFSGYVFGMDVNFDPDISTAKIDELSKAAGDDDLEDPWLRKYARHWTTADYEMAIVRSIIQRKRKPPNEVEPSSTAAVANGSESVGGGELEVDAAEADEISALIGPNVDASLIAETKLPNRGGAQIHFEYTVHAHFRRLRHMLSDFRRLCLSFDQDPTIRAAVLSTFVDAINTGRVDAFMVDIDKKIAIDEKRRLRKATLKAYKVWKALPGNADLSEFAYRTTLFRAEIIAAFGRPVPKEGRWIAPDFSTMAEPKKKVCWLTERPDILIPPEAMAASYARASLHAIDRFFERVRRRLMPLERPIHTPSNALRTWNGYANYNPAQVQKMLDILRCWHNFVEPIEGKDVSGRVVKATPAQRVGLARGPVLPEDIIHHRPSWRHQTDVLLRRSMKEVKAKRQERGGRNKALAVRAMARSQSES
jgi:hypothetical protein